MSLELNPISLLMAFLVTVGGLVGVGGYAAQGDQHIQELQPENSFEAQIKANVTQVDNEIQALKLEKDNTSIGKFRADCQDSQQFITEKYQIACRNSGMKQEDRELNSEYKAFLIEASEVIDVYLKRDTPDFTDYETRRDNLLKK